MWPWGDLKKSKILRREAGEWEEEAENEEDYENVTQYADANQAVTKRLALVNLDWEKIEARDLQKLVFDNSGQGLLNRIWKISSKSTFTHDIFIIFIYNFIGTTVRNFLSRKKF